MPRILRNYLISFIIIGLFFLIVTLINRHVADRMPAPQKATESAPR